MASEALEILQQIDPSTLDYNEWSQVGMALHACGATADDWDSWSRRDSARYVPNDCQRKWRTFRRDNGGVGIGTLAKIAKDHGARLPRRQRQDVAFEWDAELPAAGVVVDPYLEEEDLDEPADWNPIEQLTRYLQTLFSNEEHVAYVVASFTRDGKWLPGKALYDRTAGDLIEALGKAKDIGAVLGDYEPAAGAWIKFNPMDGQGYSDRNVTDWRYALVESDNMEIGRQLATLRQMELPISTLVHSGGKSLHATVHIGAANESEYRQRVAYLYEICRKNGLTVDKQNCNPSRLSRMPGIMRGAAKQWLVATKIGKRDWTEWHEWIEAANDLLPEVQSAADIWDNMPALSDPLIDGLLRRRHKMGISGPSKAGKSFLQIGLAVSIVEGRRWLSHQCTQGRVLFVNLEIDPASFWHRVKDVYGIMGLQPKNIKDLDVWNLRGKSLPMDKLAPALIRRAIKRNYSAIIIDPIYKVITGDENSAEQMSKFFNNFDRVCSELGTSIIYCHHHSKGAQGHKSAQDRSSGSGVFARDPDAVIDLIELEVTDAIRETLGNRMACEAAAKLLDVGWDGWRNECPQDDHGVAKRLLQWIDKQMPPDAAAKYRGAMADARKVAESMTGWRMEATLREFPSGDPVKMWFRYPCHTLEHADLLKDALAAGEEPPRRKKEDAIAQKKDDTKQQTLMAFSCCDRDEDGMVTWDAMAAWIASGDSSKMLEERTMRERIKNAGLVWKKGYVVEKKEIAEVC